MANPFQRPSPWCASSYPAVRNASAGASESASLVSCMSSTSGFARSSHHRTLSRRAFRELTFQVAIRTGNCFSERRADVKSPSPLASGDEVVAEPAAPEADERCQHAGDDVVPAGAAEPAAAQQQLTSEKCEGHARDVEDARGDAPRGILDRLDGETVAIEARGEGIEIGELGDRPAAGHEVEHGPIPAWHADAALHE